MKRIASFVISLLVFASTACADMSLAKMEAPAIVETKPVVSYFEGLRKTRKLTSEEGEVFELAKISRDVFGISQFIGVAGESSVTTKVIADAMSDAILKRVWATQLPPADLARLNAKATSLKEKWGADSYPWAWLLFHRGDKQEAKDTLARSFDKGFGETMKLKETWFSSSPIAKEEATLKALAPMSTPDEKKERENRLQKMRLHISNLPDMMIKT